LEASTIDLSTISVIPPIANGDDDNGRPQEADDDLEPIGNQKEDVVDAAFANLARQSLRFAGQRIDAGHGPSSLL
jgi:hypothetical protein